jgi:hypothetical protein
MHPLRQCTKSMHRRRKTDKQIRSQASNINNTRRVANNSSSSSADVHRERWKINNTDGDTKAGGHLNQPSGNIHRIRIARDSDHRIVTTIRIGTLHRFQIFAALEHPGAKARRGHGEVPRTEPITRPAT